MEDTVSEQKIMTEIVPLSYQLSPLSQENCLKSIIDSNYTTVSQMKYSHEEKIKQRNLGSLRSSVPNQI